MPTDAREALAQRRRRHPARTRRSTPTTAARDSGSRCRTARYRLRPTARGRQCKRSSTRSNLPLPRRRAGSVRANALRLPADRRDRSPAIGRDTLISSLDRQCAGSTCSLRSIAALAPAIVASASSTTSCVTNSNVAACGCAVLFESRKPESAGHRRVMQRIDEVALPRDRADVPAAAMQIDLEMTRDFFRTAARPSSCRRSASRPTANRSSA